MVVVPLVAFACGGPDEEASPHPLTTDVKEGIATFYDADGSGNCSFDKTPDDLDVTALSMPEYDKSASCGACLRVKGPNGEITVRVVDSCPGCAQNDVDLDLSASAFAKLADPSKGRIPITYQLVACKVSGNVAYHFKDGSSKFWTAIQLRNHRIPIARLEYKSGSSYVAMTREVYNYFVASSGVGDQPSGLTLRVTGVDGQVIEETLPGPIPSDKTVAGTKQFE
jgi:expansin (peptidoglycan-binding protein)